MGGPWALIIMAVVSIAGVIIMLAQRSRRRANAPEPGGEVDLQRYAGTWYEIARIPSRGNLDCIANTVTYEPKGKRRLRLEHTCRVGTFDGPEKSWKGAVWISDESHQGRMKVRHGIGLAADYWIIHLDEGYTTAVVLGPDRMRLRILHREPDMPERQYKQLLRELRERGVDTGALVPTPQPDSPLESL
jgi:apolipoprotein D and lipocalin family protein